MRSRFDRLISFPWDVHTQYCRVAKVRNSYIFFNFLRNFYIVFHNGFLIYILTIGVLGFLLFHILSALTLVCSFVFFPAPFFFPSVLGIQRKASCMLRKYCITELHPQPWSSDHSHSWEDGISSLGFAEPFRSFGCLIQFENHWAGSRRSLWCLNRVKVCLLLI